MKQSMYFVNGEGDVYFERNRSSLDALADGKQPDLVLELLQEFVPSAKTVLEIGAANGWRLARLHSQWQTQRCSGLDPSRKAVAAGRARYPELDLHVGVAQELPFASDSFDLVIFGFCLYLCDRDQLFTIASEANRVLKAPGLLVVHDFLPNTPCRNAYAHLAGVQSYKMDYANMFDWNPEYEIAGQVSNIPLHASEGGDRREAATLLRKSALDRAYPNCCGKGSAV